MDNEKREWIDHGNGEIEWMGKPSDNGLDRLRERVREIAEDNHVSITARKRNLEAIGIDECPGYGQHIPPSSLLGILHQSADYQNKLSIINEAIALLEMVLDGCSTYTQVVQYKLRECPSMKNPQFCKRYRFEDGRKIDPEKLRRAISREKKRKEKKRKVEEDSKGFAENQVSLKIRETAQMEVCANRSGHGQEEKLVRRPLLKNRE
ncbi:MAG: hypothetical protein BWX81_02419 [Spirochaetes bacterium ADurb.Bin110]|jgi:hypothetical protein|nr:MAG: hypothetical protein BWX81_02419 [Spirochaetes bacterium ADurb.Bin110]